MISAGLSGLVGAVYIDRFARKKALLVLFAGFLCGTLCCAFSNSYGMFLGARLITGAFGGMLTAVVHTIIGDAIPLENQGRATGVIMAAFSVAAVAGVPVGLYLANLWGWSTPFFIVVGIGIVVAILVMYEVPQVDSHLDVDDPGSSKAHVTLQELVRQYANKAFFPPFSLMLFLMLAGFSIIPFIAPYMVSNVGVREGELPLLYFFGGMMTFFTSPKLGKMADQYGKERVFFILCLASIAPILLMTNLPPSPLWVAILSTIFLMVLINGRIVCATALLQTTVQNEIRGSFMSLVAAVRQGAAGIASLIGGMIVGEGVSGTLTHYSWVGYFAATMTLICAYLGTKIKPVVHYRKS